MSRVLAAVSTLLLVLLVAAVGALLANRPPLLRPPGPWVRLAVYLRTNVAQTAPDAVFPELRTRRYALAPSRLIDVVARAARISGLRDLKVHAGAHVLTAVAVTPLWRFRDDVRVEVRPDGHGGSLLDARSASRVGRADFAANEHHLLVLFAAIERVAAGGTR